MLVAIKAELAKRIQPAQSTEQTRYYLNGFCVEPCLSGAGVNIVATDGHILACFRDADGVVDDAKAYEGRPIISLDGAALKACGAKSRIYTAGQMWLVVEGDANKSTATVVAANDAESAINAHRSGSLEFVTHQAIGKHFIDGTFPDWRRVIPSGEMELGAAGCFNPLLLAKLQKCVQEAKGGTPLTIERSKASPHEAPMLVNGGSGSGLEWFGVLMPARGVAGGLPAWLNPPVSPGEPETSEERALRLGLAAA